MNKIDFSEYPKERLFDGPSMAARDLTRFPPFGLHKPLVIIGNPNQLITASYFLYLLRPGLDNTLLSSVDETLAKITLRSVPAICKKELVRALRRYFHEKTKTHE